MKYKGINYDVGTTTLTGRITREVFDVAVVTKELEIIKDELQCNAIRISGLDIERLVIASQLAFGHGLRVWFSPFMPYADQETTLHYIGQAAAAAEKLRSEVADIVFVLGCELSLFTPGFVKGDTGTERMKNLFSPLSLVKNSLGVKRRYNSRLNKFLLNVMNEIRKHFRGSVTYASGTWEKVDWKMFDMKGIDFYRSLFNKSIYRKELQKHQGIDKPLAIMEFGCCSYKGAADKGATGWAIVDWKKDRPELKGKYIRDEMVQADYLLDLLNIYTEERVYAVFVFTFVSYNYVYNEDPKYDLDMASYGIVKAMPYKEGGYYKNMPWQPKQAFLKLTDYYKNH